jgi:hypothetical protein
VNWRAKCRVYPPGSDPAGNGYVFL